MEAASNEFDKWVTVVSAHLCKKYSGRFGLNMILSSKEALEFVRTQNPQKLYTYDIESLYTNLDSSKVANRIMDEIKEVPCIEEEIDGRRVKVNTRAFYGRMKGLFATGYCNVDGTLFVQTNGLPMGAAFSPKIANLYLQILEWTYAKTPAVPRIPFVRYIDDILSSKPFPWRTIYGSTDLVVKETKDEGPTVFLDLTFEKEGTGWTVDWFFQAQQAVLSHSTGLGGSYIDESCTRIQPVPRPSQKTIPIEDPKGTGVDGSSVLRESKVSDIMDQERVPESSYRNEPNRGISHFGETEVQAHTVLAVQEPSQTPESGRSGRKKSSLASGQTEEPSVAAKKAKQTTLNF
jgi:hypothetical protein